MIKETIIKYYMSPEEIKADKKALGMTTEEYADHLGVSVHTVKSWINGRRRWLISVIRTTEETGDKT